MGYVSFREGKGLLRSSKDTPPRKKRMSLENQWLEDVFPIKIVLFKGTC